MLRIRTNAEHRSTITERSGILAVKVEQHDAGRGKAILLRDSGKQAGDGCRLAGAGTADHGTVPADEAVQVDVRSDSLGTRDTADRDVRVRIPRRVHQPKIRLRDHVNGIADRRILRDTALEASASTAFANQLDPQPAAPQLHGRVRRTGCGARANLYDDSKEIDVSGGNANKTPDLPDPVSLTADEDEAVRCAVAQRHGPSEAMAKMQGPRPLLRRALRKRWMASWVRTNPSTPACLVANLSERPEF
ncbi:MAG: hypothetical protein WD749_02835 [Phycisphaerales bacterium]